MKTVDVLSNGVSTEYKVAYTPISNKQINELPKNVQEQIADLFITSQSDPRSAIPILKKLITLYPKIPQLFNFITTAYSMLEDYDTAEKYALESCRRHPEYLFAKINCAEIYLRKNEFQKIPAIFDYKLNLRLLYPKRDEFHLTEVIGFTGVCGKYYFKTGDRTSAKDCLRIIDKLSPESPIGHRLRAMLEKRGAFYSFPGGLSHDE